MALLHNHKNSMPEQVEENKQNIATLEKYIKPAYKANSSTMTPEDTTIDISNTTIPNNITEGFLLSENGLLFNIVGIRENIVYIYFWADFSSKIAGATGPRGPQGATGPQGPQGVGVKDIEISPMSSTEAGIQYHMEITLTDGTPVNVGDFIAPKGDKGQDGTSFKIIGTVNSVSELPTDASAGDAYFVGAEAPRDVYSYDGTTWTNQGALQGPEGPAGPQGEQGLTGARGPQGEQGPAGIGFTYLEAFQSDYQYKINDVVTYHGSSYVCILAYTSATITPDQDDEHWAIIAERGDNGATGAQGPQGEQGPAGETIKSELVVPSQLHSFITQKGYDKIYRIKYPYSISFPTNNRITLKSDGITIDTNVSGFGYSGNTSYFYPISSRSNQYGFISSYPSERTIFTLYTSTMYLPKIAGQRISGSANLFQITLGSTDSTTANVTVEYFE